MIQIEKHGDEYIVVNTQTRRVLGRSKSQAVALEQYHQRVTYAERREAQLRLNEARRAEMVGA